MKVVQVKAFKANDGCVFEDEREAIEQNINEIIDKTGIVADDTYTIRNNKMKHWAKDNQKDIRYLLANINKII